MEIYSYKFFSRFSKEEGVKSQEPLTQIKCRLIYHLKFASKLFPLEFFKLWQDRKM